ncbi:hypothetical protein M8J75_013057 [Diaphorina citri]|nr:hypothetical protein M8J75_013057 [Diaphorina citri]
MCDLPDGDWFTVRMGKIIVKNIPYVLYLVTYHVEMCDLPDGDWFTVRMGKIIVKNIPYVLYLVTYHVEMCDLPDGDWFTVRMGKIIVKNIPYVLYLVTYHVEMCDLPDGDWFTVRMGKIIVKNIPYVLYLVTYHVEMCDLPDGDWFTARMGIRSCACDISNLVPFRDYKFRIRVENKYGLSDPSPFAQTMREKLNPERPKFEPYLPPGVPFHPDKSFYFPRDFDLERPPREGYAQAPRFLNQEHDTQYGIKNENSSLFWFVYGYPKPKVSFYFNDELIEMGGRYDSSYTRNGQATLFINKMLDRDVGMYEALASNEHGTARQRVRLEIAEYPHFIVRPEETYVMMRRTCKLEARIWGVPYPEIKWYKDWKPLTESSRHKIQWIEPDHCVLTIGDCIGRDEGLYSVTARNIAGTISHSVTVHVEDNENEYSYRTYARGRQVKTRTKPITDAYDFGDELGRGVTGIVYHAVERSSGRNYAAKVMTGKGNQYKSLFKNELDIMNQLCHRNLVRLHDSYETKDSFTIISELAGGGELLHSLTRQSYYTEYDIAHYIRQLLSGLDYMHRLSIAHLGLTPGDLLVAHPGGRHLLLTDFGLSRRITSFGKLNPLEYGMPEFVAPEIANGKGVGFAADMWSTGVLTYLLLTGVSLFRGNDDAETLTKVKDGHFMFRREHWENISEEARDFISKLIVVDANTRMDVRQALRHPWLNFADRKPTEDTPKLNTDALRNYYNLYKDWYGNAAVRRYYRRRPLNSCYTHPSRMIYPPGTQFTPEPTPDKVLVSRDLRDVKTWEDNVPNRGPEHCLVLVTLRDVKTWEDHLPNRGPAIDYDLNVVKSESHYQNGPDTYLLQLRDVDFPVRLREYIKVASTRPGFNCLDTSENGHLDWKAPVIRERRRFTDVMDEEIDDERRNRINKYGAADTYTLRRLRHEIGTRPEAHVEADALIESRRDGHAPFFREKPITIPVVIGDKLEMKCLAFREDKDGRCIMTIEPVLNADLGIFKIVARNRKGQTVTRCRVVEATTPMAPDSPEAVDISDTEILLRWKQPSYDGHAPVICYSLQFKEADEVDWITLANNIDHEFWHVKDLKRETNYTFRLSAKNVIGWSEKGIPSALFKTKEQGNGQYKVAVTPAMKHLQAITEAGHTPTLAQDPPPLNYSVEDSPIEWSTEPPTDKYQFISEIHR